MHQRRRGAEAVGDAGIVVPPRDTTAIAEACLRLLGDPELRASLAAKARDRVMERFTLAQSLTAYRDLYERITTPELTAEPAPDSADAPVPAVIGRAYVRRPVGRARVFTADATGMSRGAVWNANQPLSFEGQRS